MMVTKSDRDYLVTDDKLFKNVSSSKTFVELVVGRRPRASLCFWSAFKGIDILRQDLIRTFLDGEWPLPWALSVLIGTCKYGSHH